MSFFTLVESTVDLGGGNLVTIRKLSAAEAQAALSAATIGNPMADPDRAIDYVRLAHERVARSIVAWEGEGFDGRPVTRENIDALPEEIITRIQQGMSALAPPMDDAEKKPSGGPLRPSTWTKEPKRSPAVTASR